MPQQQELPAFIVHKSEDFPNFVLVWCQRPNCPSQQRPKRPFLVHKATWLKKRVGLKDTVIRGRVCPYCHKVSLPH